MKPTIFATLLLLVSCGKSEANYYTNNTENAMPKRDKNDDLSIELHNTLGMEWNNTRQLTISGYILRPDYKSFPLYDKNHVKIFLENERAKIKLAEKQLEDIEKMSEEL